MNDLILREDSLLDNPTARVPICLVLDCSGSMSGSPIDELNKGVEQFFQAVLDDEVAKYSAEVSVVTFGGSVSTMVDFNSVDKVQPPHLYAGGGTPMGEAVQTALRLLEDRKNDYRNAGVEYYQPWMVLMSDGAPTDSIDVAAKLTTDLVNEKKLTIFPIIIGDDSGARIIAKFSPKLPPLKLKGLNFREFFEWLSKSVSRVSQSIPGETIQLDTEGIKAWGEIPV
jgi:uncharacterized protein YegL